MEENQYSLEEGYHTNFSRAEPANQHNISQFLKMPTTPRQTKKSLKDRTPCGLFSIPSINIRSSHYKFGKHSNKKIRLQLEKEQKKIEKELNKAQKIKEKELNKIKKAKEQEANRETKKQKAIEQAERKTRGRRLREGSAPKCVAEGVDRVNFTTVGHIGTVGGSGPISKFGTSTTLVASLLSLWPLGTNSSQTID